MINSVFKRYKLICNTNTSNKKGLPIPGSVCVCVCMPKSVPGYVCGIP